MTDVFTDWKPGDPPLKGGVIAATLRYLRARIDALYAMGLQAEGVAEAVVAYDRRSFHLVSTTGRALADIPLAAAPLNERVEGWGYGNIMAPGDWFYYPLTRSSYVVRTAHRALDFEVDLASGRFALIARGGQDANQRYRGFYSPDLTYVIGDITAINTPAGVTLYQAADTIPSGPGNAPETTWKWVRITPYSVTDFRERWRGPVATGDVVLAHVPIRYTRLFDAAAGSIAKMAPAPTASVSFSVRVNGTEIGTLAFAANSGTGVWTLTGQYVGPGSLIEIVAKSPASASTNLVITVMAE